MVDRLSLPRLLWRAQTTRWRRAGRLAAPTGPTPPSTPPDLTVGRGAPRPEHPRPQLVRPTWVSLNGEWDFAIDAADTGLERGLLTAPYDRLILVPFAPESTASGIGHTDFMEAVWYRRVVQVPADWQGLRPLLHLAAVDHDATVWANGVEVARHRGGFTGFTADLSGVAGAGDAVEIVVRARDSRHGVQARGKQSTAYANEGCFYTRTTGIWASVWLEGVPDVHVRRLHVTPSLATGSFDVDVVTSANPAGWRVRAELTRDAGHGDTPCDDTVVASAEARADLDLAPRLHLALPDPEVRPWGPGHPHLYGLTVSLVDADGAVVDEVVSYAGLRSISLAGRELRLNGERCFQRLVLDQGYWPHTLMTAPTDAALEADIRLGLEAGFNGARLHQKVVEERYLFHADRLGYLVWGELGDWGARTADGDHPRQEPTASFITQWVEVLARDVNHPSIIGWCPMNETEQDLDDRITVLDDVQRGLFHATKTADPTRPVIDASGWAHRVPETDVYDAHTYEQAPWKLAVLAASASTDDPLRDLVGRHWSVPYRGQPYWFSEFGGIWWNPDATDGGDDQRRSWGYGERCRSEEEVLARFEGMVAALLDQPDMFGYCYTQLTDVFQEENGIYRFDRTRKLDVGRIAAAQQRPSAYEEHGPTR